MSRRMRLDIRKSWSLKEEARSVGGNKTKTPRQLLNWGVLIGGKVGYVSDLGEYRGIQYAVINAANIGMKDCIVVYITPSNTASALR